MSSEIRVLLAGAGRAGLVHGRNFAAGIRGARLVAIADPDEQAREAAAAELDPAIVFDDPEKAAVSDEIDAVVVAAPTFAHAPIVRSALLAGKHVLCEKPLAASLAEARELVDLAERSESRLLMAFMRRFDEGFLRAEERITAGDIGAPVLVRSTCRGPGLPPPWAWDPQVSGGLIAEVNSHDIDTARWLSGKEFVSAHAFGAAAKRPDIRKEHPDFVDVVIASFELEDSVLAQIDGACPADYGYDARIEIYGTEGVIFVGSPVKPGAMVVRADGASADPVTSWRALFADAYRAEDAHLIEVARGEAAPLTTAIDGLRALEVVFAVNESLRTGRTVHLEEVQSS